MVNRKIKGAVALCVCMAILTALFSFSFAATVPAYNITTSLNAQHKLEVTVALTNANQFNDIQLYLGYDKASLKPDSYENPTGDPKEDNSLYTTVNVSAKDGTNDVVLINSFVSHAYGKKDATLAKVLFTVTSNSETAKLSTKTVKAEANEETVTVKEVTVTATLHNYSAWTVTKPATCSATGTSERTCSVNKCQYKLTRTDAIVSTAHAYDGKWIPDGDAQHKQVCANNTSHVIRENHSLTSTVTAVPTCTATGTRKYDCSVCGYTRTEEIGIDHDNHKFTNYEYNNDATCEKNGTETAVCDNGCGKKDTREKAETAIGHNWGDWAPDEQGHHFRVCANDPSHVDTVDHTYGEGTVITEPTCAAEGQMLYVCTVCEYEKLDAIPINPDNHSFEKTWSSDETNHFKKCANDGSHRIEVAEHVWDEGEVTAVPTCTAEGQKKYVCTICGHEKFEAIPVDPDNHNYSDSWSSDETNHFKACAYDNTHRIEVTEHVWDEGEVTAAPTCTAEGQKKYVCTICGYERTETLPVDSDGHNFAESWSSDAVNHFKVCLYDNSHLNEIAGHVWEKTVIQEASCTKDGIVHYKCTVCDFEKTENEGKNTTAHAYPETWQTNDKQHFKICANSASHRLTADHTFTVKSETPATCSKKGSRTVECSVCKYTRTEDISATGKHIWTTVTVEPTCTEDGSKVTKCSVCGTVAKTEKLTALGHTEPDKDGKCTRCSAVIGEPAPVTEPTTAAPEPTTAAPEPTTATPEPTTAMPEPTTAAPTTAAPETTTRTAAPTTKQAETTTKQAAPTTKKAEPTTKKAAPTTAKPVEPTSLATMYGDVDLNGKVNAKDARLALRYSAKLESLTAQQIANAAVALKDDKTVKAKDARLILRYSAKLETTL